MEKRVIVAIVLSILVLVLWQAFFVKSPQRNPAAEQAAQGQAPVTVPMGKPIPPVEKKAPGQSASLPAKAEDLTATGAQTEEEIKIDTPLYTAVWTNKGGVLKSWKLKEHKNEKKEGLDLVPVQAAQIGRYPFSIWTEDPSLAETANSAFFKAQAGKTVLSAGEQTEVRFEYSDGRGLKVEKVFTETGGKYSLGISIHAWKDGREIEPGLVWGPGIGNPSPAELKQRFSSSTGAAVLSAGKVLRADERKLKTDQAGFNFAEWAAYEENYFAALFTLAPGKGTAVFRKEAAAEGAPAYFLYVSRPDQAYIGPKEIDALKEFGSGAKKIINFGFFGAIAEILLISIKFFHRFIPNWGVSIILMTIVIKIIFFPLTLSSTKSMAKMQELQPKIKALKAKYKRAKQDIEQRRQMNEEMMRLYKEHGVNPAGGCLPLLIQLPVFWGVFRMLVVAVEFRHSPFALWITDLSVKDPYYVTPILMGATQFIQQKMTPTTADPSQARMMLIMPVVMTVFFMNFQSGLILYWLTTNVLQIAQQALINRMTSKKKRESNGKRRKD
jgi:YidC/Oxa1 family membrane protein insertase